jgi:hypothetical protein
MKSLGERAASSPFVGPAFGFRHSEAVDGGVENWQYVE